MENICFYASSLSIDELENLLVLAEKVSAEVNVDTYSIQVGEYEVPQYEVYFENFYKFLEVVRGSSLETLKWSTCTEDEMYQRCWDMKSFDMANVTTDEILRKIGESK